MHHLPQFLLINTDARRKNKKSPTKPKPKLERLNTRRIIDYEVLSTSGSFFEETYVWSFGYRGNQIQFQSVDLSTSFRIDGNDLGQLEVVYRSLGLESLEEFGIPVKSCEARKIRSSSEIVSGSRLDWEVDCDRSETEHGKLARDVEIRCDDVVRVSCASVEVKSDDVDVDRVSDCNRAGNGIRGVRSPLLSSPSSSLVVA